MENMSMEVFEDTTAALQRQVTNETVAKSGEVNLAHGAGPSTAVATQLSSIAEIRDKLAANIDSRLSSTGSFYHIESSMKVPNPRLLVEGYGPVELPLDGETAKGIIKLALPADLEATSTTGSSHGWQVKCPNFWFENPSWKDFMDFDVVQNVCKTLGVEVTSSARPRCELQRLIVLAPGSRLPSLRLDDGPNSVFAKVLAFLPSTYAGGQISLTHDSQMEIVDTASACSSGKTTFLAWYSDVSHEVECLSTGYSLILCYDLIHTTSTAVPRPVETSQIPAQIRATLTRWSNSILPSGEVNFISYTFKDRYTEDEMKEHGLKMLHENDATIIAHLKPILDELGFECWLAWVTCKIKGQSVGNVGRGPYESREGPTYGLERFSDIDYETIKVDGLYELDGTEIVIFNDPIEPQDQNLIPKDPFLSTEPDQVQPGTNGRSRKHWYHRASLLILPESSGFAAIFDTAGVDYALKRMKPVGSGSPSPSDKRLANAIIDHLRGDGAKEIAAYAFEWNDLELWNKAVSKSRWGFMKAYGQERLVAGWKKWGFEAVKTSYEKLATSGERVNTLLEFYRALPSSAGPEELDEVARWSDEQILHSIACCTNDMDDYVSLMIDIGKQKGARILVERFLPRMMSSARSGNRPHRTFSFIKALQANKEAILSASSSLNSCGTQEFDKLIVQSLDALWCEWDKLIAHSAYTYYEPVKQPASLILQAERVVEVIELFIITGHRDLCDRLSSVIDTDLDGDLRAKRFKHFYDPLLKKLVPRLIHNEITMSTPPFDRFFRSLIQQYLQDKLPLPATLPGVSARRFGCQCSSCSDVDRFIGNVALYNQWNPGPISHKQLTHLEGHLTTAKDLVTFTKEQWGPYNPEYWRLTVTKCPVLITVQKREALIADIKSFLLTMGNADDVLKLLDNDYPEVRAILSGNGHLNPSLSIGVDVADSSNLDPMGLKRKRSSNVSLEVQENKHRRP